MFIVITFISIISVISETFNKIVNRLPVLLHFHNLYSMKINIHVYGTNRNPKSRNQRYMIIRCSIIDYNIMHNWYNYHIFV